MDPRFSLRFESGERAGEVVPIQGQGFTIGRRPGHALQILDNSVSGKHAEIVVGADGALLRDLGSTNGTRVGGERVIESKLVNGARVQFGTVDFVFLDSQVGGFRGGAAPSAGTADGGPPIPGDALQRVSPEVLAKSRKRSTLGLVGIVIVVGGAAAAWFTLGGSGEGAGPSGRPAVALPTNLLGEDFSFEAELDGWKAAEGAPAAFQRSAQARVSGGLGLLVELGPGDWALHRSREVHAEAGSAFSAEAQVRVEGGASAQIGIELLPAGSGGADASETADVAATAPRGAIAWSEPRPSRKGFESVEVSTLVPPGYDAARVVILAKTAESGAVAVDDTSLERAPAASVAGSLAVRDYQVVLLGDPARTAVLARFGKPLISLVAFGEGSSIPETAAAQPMTARAEATRVALVPAGGSIACLRAEPGLVRAGLATIAAEGYSTHGLEFERSGVTSLLLGKGQELVRVIFPSAVTLQGVAEGPASRVVARGVAGEIVLQLDFSEERKLAGDLAYAARNAGKKGDLGECLARWAELLNSYPFDADLVQEAEAKRAALVQQGLSELQAVRAEIERAKFFRLVDLYRQCRSRAVDVGTRFRGSEVDAEARKVAAEVDQQLVGYEADLARAERGRLTAILLGLETRGAAGLAAKVRKHLETLPEASPKSMELDGAAAGDSSSPDTRKEN